MEFKGLVALVTRGNGGLGHARPGTIIVHLPEPIGMA